MSNYLITGGAGFIGSNIADRLIQEGHSIRILDDLSSGKMENLRKIETKVDFIKGCISNKTIAEKVVKDMDYILHQAALRSVPKSIDNPENFNRINIEGSLNLLLAATKQKIKKFVFASSSSIYGNAQGFPQKETFLPQPISPYAITKITGEYYCRVFAECYGLKTASLRYFNVFGPRQDLEDEYSVVIPKFITCMIKGTPPPVHGDGTQSRDFTYIDNVVEGNLLVCSKDQGKGEVYNIACGQEQNLLDLINNINKILGKDIKPTFQKSRAGDVKRTLADISKIKSALGWKPSVNFGNGLEKTVKWWMECQNN